MKQISVVLLSALALFASCKKDHPVAEHTGTFSSPEVAMYNGKVKTWVSVKDGVPQQLAISINDAAMNSLPTHTHNDTTGDHGHHDHNETVVPLPAQAAATAFDHIAINWNPEGHPPVGVYSFPHFDFHFYMISKSEQMNIPKYEDDSTGFQKFPAAHYLPANYVPIPGGEAAMGKHWVDVTSPEMGGAPFTQTFIYGSYNSKVNFYEPMITKAFLNSTTHFERSIPKPAAVQKSGYYPTKMKIAKHDGVTEIILDGFVQRQAQ